MKNSLNLFGSIPGLFIHLKLLVSISLVLLFLPNTIPSSKLHAQEHDLRFEHITVKQGLSHTRINCIGQDSRGFMWFGTNEGLNKYDGYEFTVFEKEIDNVEKMSDDYILSIFEDSRGNLWIGTGDAGLNIYDKTSNQFTYITNHVSSEIRIGSNNVKSILEDSKGNLWIGTDASIDMVNLENKKAVNYIPPHFNDINSNKSIINVLYEDRQNNLWFGTGSDGLGLFNRENKTYEYFRHDINDKTSISANGIVSIYEDHSGNLWVGTNKGGFNLFDREKKVFYCYLPDPKNMESFNVKSIMDRDNGNLWIGTQNGLYLFNKSRHQFIHYAHDPHNSYSMSQNDIRRIYKDSKGNFWFGTKKGINFLNTMNMAFVHYRADISNKTCLNNSKVESIFEDSLGDLWFGTEGGGLNCLNRDTGIFKYFTHDPDDPNSLGSNNVPAIIEDKNGYLWIGNEGGLNVFDRKKNRFIHNKFNQDDPLISGKSIRSLFFDIDGDVWIGLSGGGLLQFNQKEQSFVQFPLNETGSEPVVYCVIRDNEGKIWAGGNDSKIHCIDKTTRKHEFYQPPTNTQNTIIHVIIEDRNENLWIGTRGSGLIFFDKKQKTFQAYKKKDGLSNNKVQGILEDDQENLWISTEKGLSKFNPETKIFKNYYEKNGLKSDEFTSACCKTHSGEMFFGGINGATAFYPDKIIENTYVPPVIITGFKISNKSVKTGGENPILTNHINETRDITLSYKHSVFSFTYAALDFGISEQIQYAYKMEGFETDWNYVGTTQSATYTNLNPGTYMFRVKAANNEGVWNEQGTSVKLTITPPFWETLWFRGVCAIFIILIVLGIIKLRISFERRARQKERSFVVSTFQDLIEKITQSSQGLASFVEEVSTSSQETSSSVQEIAHGMDVQSERFKKVMQTSQVVSSSADQVSKQAKRSEEATKNISESTGASEVDLEEILKQIDDISRITSDSTQKIKELGKKSEHVNSIADAISDISNQTDLLALNARIQAAHAGKYGAGFNVVASEIGKLANHSNDASGEISSIIEDILKSSEEAVDNAQSVSNAVDSGKVRIDEFGDKLKKIIFDVKGVNEITHEIYQAADLQQDEMKNLSSSIESMVTISEQAAKGSDNITYMIQEQSNALNDVSQLASNLAEIVKDLEDLAEKFGNDSL